MSLIPPSIVPEMMYVLRQLRQARDTRDAPNICCAPTGPLDADRHYGVEEKQHVESKQQQQHHDGRPLLQGSCVTGEAKLLLAVAGLPDDPLMRALSFLAPLDAFRYLQKSFSNNIIQ
jgi:hypothetical protein